MRWFRRSAAILIALTCTTAALAGAVLIPEKAPPWKTSSWFNGNPGNVKDQVGKVVLIEFFQLWCPVSNQFSIPLFHRWSEMYGNRDDIVLLSIHTVFEGHDVQTPRALREFIAEKGITRPVGIDAYDFPGDTEPVTAQRYETEGTPQIAIIDKFGTLRWSHFGRFDPRPVEGFIDRLLLEKTEDAGLAQGGGATKKDSGRSAKSSRPEPPSRSTRGSSPGRAKTSGRTQPRQDQDEEDDSGPDYTGKYRVTIEQLSKSCGELLPPQTVFADLVVQDGSIEVRFSRRFLGQQEVTLEFNERSGSFEASASGPAEDQGTDVNLDLNITGQFLADTEPPQIEFDFQLEKVGDDAESNCSIEGTGTGGKAGA
jgi:thiol-disulfide isomerase/thioredoxin